MYGVAQVGYVVVGVCVYLAGGVRASIVAVAAVCSVKPHFKLVGSVGCQLVALAQEHVLDITVCSVAVVGRVAVPGRDVESVFHVEIACGVGKCFGNVDLAVGVAAVLDRVLGGLGGPQAESVVMLHHGYAAFHAGGFHGFEPLTGVGFAERCVLGLRFVAVAPFLIGECVHAVVEESVEFRLVPFYLTVVGHRMDGRRFIVGV